jgi:hypothetical protein
MDLLNGNVYIGGNFTGTDKTNVTYTNIVQYDSSTSEIKALENGGLDGVVQSVACSDTGKKKKKRTELVRFGNTNTNCNTIIEIFVGGTFTALSGTGLKVDYLSNVARYDTQKKTWSALNGVSYISKSTLG